MTRFRSPLSYTGRIAARSGLFGESERVSSGVATLVAGVATIALKTVRSDSVIILTKGAINGSTAIGFPFVTSQTAGTGFAIDAQNPVIPATETNDISDVYWMVFNP